MLYHNFLGDIRTMRHNVNSKAKLLIEQNCLRAVPARMQGCPAKLSVVSKKRLSTSLPVDVQKWEHKQACTVGLCTA